MYSIATKWDAPSRFQVIACAIMVVDSPGALIQGFRLGSVVEVDGASFNDRLGRRVHLQCPLIACKVGPSSGFLREGDRLNFGLQRVFDLEFSELRGWGLQRGPAQWLHSPGTAGSDEAKRRQKTWTRHCRLRCAAGPEASAGLLGRRGCYVPGREGFLRLKDEVEQAFDYVKSLAQSGKLERLPEEVEEGYLGEGARARVAWMDPSDRNSLQDVLFSLVLWMKVLSVSLGALQPLLHACEGDDEDGFIQEIRAALSGGFQSARAILESAKAKSAGAFGEFALRCLVKLISNPVGRVCIGIALFLLQAEKRPVAGAMGQCQSTDVGADTLLEEEAQAAGSLVCRSQARTFPPVPGKATVLDYASSASAAEECAFFLEQVVSVPGIDDAMRACASSRLPYVRVWVESGGKTLGEVAEWPSRPSSHPSWFSARKLGLRMAAALSATLRIEVCDGSTVLGSAQTNMKDLRVHQRIELAADVRPGLQKSSVVFQILDCQAVLRPKSVYLIRHGESEWNKAQRSLNLHGMVRTTDHPLSAKGRDQAEALRHLLQMELDKAGSDKADPSVAPMLQPGLILASPLGRALQTAIIAYGPLLEKAKLGRNELVLAPNCKEKQNFGGLDTVCTKLGEEILQSSQEELRVLYSRLEKDKFIVDAFRQLRFDVEEVQERWWPEGQAESTGQLKARMREFMYQLLFSSQESLVIFGHSLFFQQLMREFLSDDVRPVHVELNGLEGGPVTGSR
eukprot:s508_g12.t2